MSTYDPESLKKLSDPFYRLKLLREQEEKEKEKEEERLAQGSMNVPAALEETKVPIEPKEPTEPTEPTAYANPLGGGPSRPEQKSPLDTKKEVPYYLTKVPEEYEEEKPASIHPDSEVYKVSELRNNAGNFIDDGTKVLRYIADHQGVLTKFLTGMSAEDPFKTLERHVEGKRKQDKSGYSPDIVEFLRDEDWRLPTLFTNAAILEDAPEDVLRAYRNIRGLWEKAEVDGAKEWWHLGVDIGTDLITDPVNLMSLLFIPVTGGGSAAAKTTAQILAKEGVKKNIKQRLASFATSRDARIMAIEGGAWTGLEDYGFQTRNIALGLGEKQDEIDWASVFGSTVVGAAAGPVLGGTLMAAGKAGMAGGRAGKKQFNKAKDWFLSDVDKKNIVNAASPDKAAARDLAENSLVSEDMQNAAVIHAERLGFTKEGSDFIESIFKAIKDPEKVVALIHSRAKEEGLGGEAVEEMTDIILRGEGPPTRGRIAQALSTTGHWIQQAPAVYGGKISTLLDPYAAKSKTVESIQKMFRYDQRRSFLGERTKEEYDYSEILGDVFGENYIRYKQSMDPILVANYGWNRQKAYQQLSSAVRGKASGDEVIDTAAANIRKQLDDTAETLKSLGLYEEADLITDNYFPRVWDRKAIKKNKESFKALLLKVGEAEDADEAEAIYKSMLSKKNDIGDPGTFTGSTFLSSRKFEKITDDTMFEKFLDNDANSVLQSYYNSISKQIAKKRAFGATTFKDFASLHMKDIEKELSEAGEEGMASKVEGALRRVWNAQTGEGAEPSKPLAGFLIDTASTAVRIAMLPLATLSSLTEVMINFGRGGVFNTVKGFGKAAAHGAQILTYDAVNALMKNHGLTRPQALRKMQRFGIALDQSVADQVERLSGDNVNHWRKTNNAFFKLNLLEPWTKLVQLTSFNVGQDIITTNLKALSRSSGETLTRRLQTKKDELLELGVDIDKGLDWVKRTAGDLEVEDDFIYDIQKGASRYTNEIILNPTKQSGLRSMALSGNPSTTLLFQLTAYPAAFTNTVLKDLGKRAARTAAKGDIGASAQVIGTVMALQAGGMLGNYARNALFTKDNQYDYKSTEQLVLEGAARWGGNGIYLDVFTRAVQSSGYRGDIIAGMSAAGGPMVGAVYSSVKSQNPLAWVPTAVPLYGAFPKDNKKRFRKTVAGWGRKISKALTIPERSVYASGGVVSNVPNVPEEPDERIDRMTGRPYNEQAGEAFIDNEDDPSRQKKVVGGIAKAAIKSGLKLIKNSNKEDINALLIKQDKALGAASEDIVNPQVSKTDYDKTWSEFEDIEDVDEWQGVVKKYVKENRDVDPVVRTPELEQSAKDLIDKKIIDRAQHLQNVQKYKPITTWESTPREPSTKSLVYSLNPAQRENGNFVVADAESQRFNVVKSFLSIGDFFNGRLDIPAYKEFDTWIVAGTSKDHKGTGTHYAKAVHYIGKDGEPVKFLASQKKGERIGTGEEGKTGYATVSGWVKSLDADDIRKNADSLLNDPDWIQVGFDPRRQGAFYTRSGDNIGAAVVEAEEVIQVGPLVLAKKAKIDPNYQGYVKGGKVSEGDNLVTNKGRKAYKDKDTGKFYSERTSTIQLDDGRWVNYPTIDREGNEIPSHLFEDFVKSQVTEDGVVDFITGEVLPTYKNADTAVAAAEKRSGSLLVQER